ncbi:PTS fructose transporter subunit IIABC [Gehongia tenuis]|uniref:PTS sugar transporter subunit IIA n=1 Tax=Gehongia tenuis TaxID=2763655 RepID=A0A926HPR1_9FIRM|nr:fructose-specific PTS transporter subunit EIIC [Gehongia tenuis]MBC8530960.1 PTS sugar transporter subunit IIA [Gehongia tenuis]
MRIVDLLSERGIDLNAGMLNKDQAIEHLVDLMAETGNLRDKETYKSAVFAREAESTTGVGEGVAIPHAKTDAVDRPGLAAMIVRDGVDFASLDGQPAHLFFLIAAPNTEENVHLEVLSRLSMLLMDEKFRSDLMAAPDAAAFLQVVDAAEKEKFGEGPKPEQTAAEGYRVLAVTACPTGIAHTYMAAESLENAGREMGISIKVETNGSGGAKNVLTKEEIAAAECIIIAADKNVEMARFNGKPVIETKVANGIHKAHELLEEAVSGRIPVYSHSDCPAAGGGFEGEKEGVGHTIYKHLMNGVSHMLPFVIGGGILIALAFLFDNYDMDPSNFGKNLPFPAFLKTTGDFAFGFMLPVLAGFIAMSIADLPGLAVGFVGGIIAKEGGAGFLGALVAGFAAGYLVLGLEKLFGRLPRSMEGIKPVLLYPVLGILIIGAFTTFVLNPPMAALNNWIFNVLTSMGSSSRVILGIVLGAMMAVDMGGPLNKAAYVFGTASLASGQFEIMAAVMVAGMVPPLAIALCTTFFKNRFTKKERQSGITNYIMGLSFITEGAIPFAAADPLRVIPACVLGSATAGALSMLFNCGLRAPHGGIFVTPVVENAPMYLVALAAGAVVGMTALAILKRPIKTSEEKER